MTERVKPKPVIYALRAGAASFWMRRLFEPDAPTQANVHVAIRSARRKIKHAGDADNTTLASCSPRPRR